MSRERPIVVVTGAASGIGAACCEVLAARGWRLVMADIELEGAKALARRIGGEAAFLDVADQACCEALAERLEAELGPVRGLVNSAGVIQRPLPPEALDMASWDHVVRVDQRGTYIACSAFGRRMAARGAGAIVNIASIAGMRSMPLHSYAPAKAAVISMTQCLAAEWGPARVRVNAVSPGYTRTPALQQAIERGERDPSSLQSNAALGRLVEPREVALAVAFLLSEDAAAITGINLPVDAGWLVAPSWHTYGGLRARE